MPGRNLRGPWRLRAYEINSEPELRPDGGLTGLAELSEEHPDFAEASARAGAVMAEEWCLCVVLDPLRDARPVARRHLFGPEDVMRRLTFGVKEAR